MGDQDAGAPEAGAGLSADAWQYGTPESLVNMEATEHEKLEELIHDGLVQVSALLMDRTPMQSLQVC